VARNFPRTIRRRAITALAAVSVLLSTAAIPAASAGDLRDREDKVARNINETLVDLDQSSGKLVAANNALGAAQVKLNDAQDHLAKTRGELAVAVVLDKQMQAKLDAAILRLEKARAELAEGKLEIAEQERFLGQIAVQNYQSGDPGLLGLSMVLTSQDPAELSSQLNSVQNVFDKEAVSLDRLEASRVILTVQEQEVEAAKADVEVQRKAAAANLVKKQNLQARAVDAEEQVSDLVKMRAIAHTAAVKARKADLEHLRGLRKERDRISEMLRERAEAARKRAAAAAAAAAQAAAASAHGSLKSNGFLDYPVVGYVSSSYGMRFHPIYKQWALHDGTDFGAACGTPIRASVAGEVIATYYNTGYGNRVIVDDGFRRGVGLGTAYNHLSAYSTRVGERVKRGEIIGYVGNTGFSTGCHLHFMVFENGVAVNPMFWL